MKKLKLSDLSVNDRVIIKLQLVPRTFYYSDIVLSFPKGGSMKSVVSMKRLGFLDLEEMPPMYRDTPEARAYFMLRGIKIVKRNNTEQNIYRRDKYQ